MYKMISSFQFVVTLLTLLFLSYIGSFFFLLYLKFYGTFYLYLWLYHCYCCRCSTLNLVFTITLHTYHLFIGLYLVYDVWCSLVFTAADPGATSSGTFMTSLPGTEHTSIQWLHSASALCESRSVLPETSNSRPKPVLWRHKLLFQT